MTEQVTYSVKKQMQEVSRVRETGELDPNQETESLFLHAYNRLQKWCHLINSNLPPDYFNQVGPKLTEKTMLFIEGAGETTPSALTTRAGEVVVKAAKDILFPNFVSTMFRLAREKLNGPKPKPKENPDSKSEFSHSEKKTIAQIRHNIILDRIKNFWRIQVRRPTIQMNHETGEEMWVQGKEGSDNELATNGPYSATIRPAKYKHDENFKKTNEIVRAPKHNQVDMAILTVYHSLRSATITRREKPNPELTPYPQKKTYSAIIGPLDKPVKILVEADLLAQPAEEFLIQMRGRYIAKAKKLQELKFQKEKKPIDPKLKQKQEKEKEKAYQARKQMLTNDPRLLRSLADENDLNASDIRVFLADVEATKNIRRIEQNRDLDPTGVCHPSTVILSYTIEGLSNVGLRNGHSPHDGMGSIQEQTTNIDKAYSDIISIKITHLSTDLFHQNSTLNPFYKFPKEQFAHESDPHNGTYTITIGDNISLGEINPVTHLRAETEKDSYINQQFRNIYELGIYLDEEEKYTSGLTIQTAQSLALFLTLKMSHGHFLKKDRAGNLVPVVIGLPDSLLHFSKGSAFGTELTPEKVANFIEFLHQVSQDEKDITQGKDSIRAMAAIADTGRDALSLTAEVLNPEISELLKGALLSMLVFNSKEKGDKVLQSTLGFRLREFTTARAKPYIEKGGFGFCDAGDNRINITYKKGEQNLVSDRFPGARNTLQLEHLFRAEYLKNLELVLQFAKKVAEYDKPIAVKQLLRQNVLQAA